MKNHETSSFNSFPSEQSNDSDTASNWQDQHNLKVLDQVFGPQDNGMETEQAPKESSKFLGKLSLLMSGVTPTFPVGVEGATVMSKKAFNEYATYVELVNDARHNIDPTNSTGYHEFPSKKQFKQWKKDGVVHAGFDAPQKPYPKDAALSKIFDLLDDDMDDIDFNENFGKDNSLQGSVWDTYRDNISIQPEKYEATVDQDTINELFEKDHAVKIAPFLRDQIKETDRNNPVTYVSNEGTAIGTNTSASYYEDQHRTLTEHDALNQLHDFLDTASKTSYLNQVSLESANAILERLSFIGEKEYKEATEGIASYWKSELDKNENLQVYAVASEISDAYSKGENGRQVKSDEYLLDNILAYFSDEELEKYAGRIVVDSKDVIAKDPRDLKVVLLDDWTISGSQLLSARASFLSKNPGFESSVEIQLIIAGEKRLRDGFPGYNDRGQVSGMTPIRSYYLAHSSSQGDASGAHISGSHSSVDYDFEFEINGIAADMRLNDGQTVMPPMTNIVRPYRKEGTKLTNKDRLLPAKERV